MSGARSAGRSVGGNGGNGGLLSRETIIAVEQLHRALDAFDSTMKTEGD